MTSEALVEMQKTIDAGGSEQERNRKSRRVHCEQQDTAQNCLTIPGKNKASGENRTHAWRPAESKCKPEQDTARDPSKRPTLPASSFAPATETANTTSLTAPSTQRSTR